MIPDDLDLGATIGKAREQLHSGTMYPALGALLNAYNSALSGGPYSVTFKSHTAPSGCKHDFLSVGPYWWPNPEKPDGLPYIRKDGMVNPEVIKLDGYAVRNLVADTTRLLLVGMLLEKQEAFERAALLLRTWFLNEETRMNPHLKYGQAIAGVCEGRGIGLIDTSGLCGLVWQLSLLEGFSGWTDTDQSGFRRWFANYLDWFLSSPLAKDECRQHNNHGTWFDAQVCAYASIAGEKAVIKNQIENFTIERIHSQIEKDGTMPHELARALPVHYSLHNLQGFLFCALHAREVGINLFNQTERYGQKLDLAANWFCRSVLPSSDTGFSQLRPMRKDAAIWSLSRLSELNGRGPWNDLLGSISDFYWQHILYRHLRTDEYLSNDGMV